MSSFQATADSIRAAVCSTAPCTSATAASLCDLLLPKTNNDTISKQSKTTKTTKKTSAAPSATRLKATSAKPTARKVQFREGAKNQHEDEEQHLTPRERSILATEVINATLKSLSDAIKIPPSAPLRRKVSSKELVKTSMRKPLSRSNSTPQSPLRRQSLSRTATSPMISPRSRRSSSTSSIISSGYRPTAECARTAFACLRALQAANIPGIDLPPLQLESGMSVLVGKLLSLGMDDLAIKELRILKRRLDAETVAGTMKGKQTIPITPPTLSELLDFSSVRQTLNMPKLGIAISTQLQALRVMASSKDIKSIEAALPILDSLGSPMDLIVLACKASESARNKGVRQLQNLSDILLSICPSVSAADDTLALESRLSVSPEVAFRLQHLAFRTRIVWWKLAGHSADETRELFDPFLRCLSAYVRRSGRGGTGTYSFASEVFTDLQRQLQDKATSKKPSVAWIGIYKLLSSIAQEANMIDEAIRWTQKLKDQPKSPLDSDTAQCFISARMVALVLRKPTRSSEDEETLLALLECLERPFKGDSSEIEALLTEVSSARRATISLLIRSPLNSQPAKQITDGLYQMCESLVFLCPRLCLRYLGKPVSGDSSTKDIVRYEQRRQFITKLGIHAIDSAVYLVKRLLSEDRMSWDLLDSKLQDCLILLAIIDINAATLPAEEQLPQNSFYVKISNLYYSYFLNQRRSANGASQNQQLKILRRSIDCVRARDHSEKKQSLFSTKLERMAEIYKDTGRYYELCEVLQNLRDEIISQGVLSNVAEAAKSIPLRRAWSIDDRASALARTIQTILKVQVKHVESSSEAFLSHDSWKPAERAVVLEYYLQLLSDQTKQSSKSWDLQLIVSKSLYALYDKDLYPLRRLCLLIRLSSLDLPDEHDFADCIMNELQATQVSESIIEGTADATLRPYLLHTQTLARSTVELQQEEPRSDIIQGCVTAWSSFITGNITLESLECRVDDIPGLLNHLQVIADYFHLKGLGSSRMRTIQLIANLSELISKTSTADELVTNLAILALQWLHLGYSGKAGMILDRAQVLSNQDGICNSTLMRLHLNYADYLLLIGNVEKSEEHLNLAQLIHSQEKESKYLKPLSTLQDKTKRNILTSDAYLITSKLALERGAADVALNLAKQSVRLLRRAWTNTEQLRKNNHRSDIENLTEDVSQLSMSVTRISVDPSVKQLGIGSYFWSLIVPLFQSLSHLAAVYAHHGMFQETAYYAEQGYKLVKEAGSEAHQALAAVLMGSILLRAGVLDRGSELLMEAKSLSKNLEIGSDTALLNYHLGKMQGLRGDRDAEIAEYQSADQILLALSRPEYITSIEQPVETSDTLENGMSHLTLSDTKPQSRRKAPTRAKANTKAKRAVARAKSPIQTLATISEECRQLTALRSVILRGKAQVLLSMKRCEESMSLLVEAGTGMSTQIETVHHGLAMARQLLTQSLDQMTSDPVYSVLQDSTISFPSVMGLAKSGDRPSATKVSPPRKLQAALNRSRSPVPTKFFEKLRQAQELLTNAHTTAITVAPIALVHKISSLLNNVSILLSAAGQKGILSIHPGIACCTIEAGRTLALRRERKAILTDPSSVVKLDDLSWPSLKTSDPRRSSIGFSQDLSRFQREYIDIIPSTWTAVSISLSDSRNELSITKMQSGHGPFVLRLPLGRNNSMDADEEVFGFEQGRSEMLDIIELANESAHDARDRTGREAKMAWWEEREALDSRLKDLLENIEKVWLGGFAGIFSQHTRKPDLLARFQKSFQNILDKHLPSRQKVGKRSAKPKVNLDSRILDLFIGLGDASVEDCDLSEPLTDLLYFVVDVLQFHGELNAYAEIDFDSIVIETHDALRCYHEAIHSSASLNEGRHTILILDKALQLFPWESLSCMEGHAVSRLPSLGCLRERIIRQQNKCEDDSAEKFYVKSDNGAYVLNPGGDLKNTQATFQKSLRSLNNWDGIVEREPTEDEIRVDLEERDIFLYFGHGSGAQYIRAREIRRLEKCAVTFLMGCSSGSLTEVGEFEPYGPAINYMHGNCPALVATLWDVTDKDIDRFAKSTFEHWGLFDSSEGTVDRKGKGKAKKKVEVEPAAGRLSLVEAVAKGRAACNLRYLNAAAVCVYGVPVYLQ
ncbi:peptidase family C50-domain-containing protein [Tricladium varicosporioides]|nr:peptidase family C50-domain-containing protein [Hymenoscyphus varicosporioides]